MQEIAINESFQTALIVPSSVSGGIASRLYPYKRTHIVVSFGTHHVSPCPHGFIVHDPTGAREGTLALSAANPTLRHIA